MEPLITLDEAAWFKVISCTDVRDNYESQPLPSESTAASYQDRQAQNVSTVKPARVGDGVRKTVCEVSDHAPRFELVGAHSKGWSAMENENMTQKAREVFEKVASLRALARSGGIDSQRTQHIYYSVSVTKS